ncbi:MAG: sulfite exporter TauE/SafE family protein [Bacteriovoracaceae bacterium]
MSVLPLFPLIIMIFTSIFTSALSAATGMGGGVLLFTVMTLYFPMSTLIPIHGIIQFFNNFFILIFLKSHLKKSLLKPFLIGSILGISAGAFLVSKIIQTKYPQIIIVLLIAYTLFRPKKLPNLELKHKNFFWVGILTGFLGIIAGAIDPVLGPFFVRKDLNKEEIIANKAFMQAIVHLAKVPVFLLLGFDYLPYLSFCIITNIACIFGTKFGIVLLQKMNEKIFLLVFKLALISTGLRLVYKIFF